MKVLQAALEHLQNNLPATLITVIGVEGSAPRHLGARMLVGAQGEMVGTIGGGAVEKRVLELAATCLAPTRVRFDLGRELGMACGGFMEVFLEPLNQAPRLLLFGAGHIAFVVARILGDLGFRITVVDERPEWANPQRFPGHDVRVLPTAEALEALPSDPNTWVLAVTHGHQLDFLVVEHYARQPWAWLGMIGSRTKVTRFLNELERSGVPVETISRISAPVGLDIGAETPEEIAVSIAAEIVRARRQSDRPPLPLAEVRRAGLHRPPGTCGTPGT